MVEWYEESLRQLGREKMIDLRLMIAPNTKDPNDAVNTLAESLRAMARARNKKGALHDGDE